MGGYRLTAQADSDLIRIHQWGVRTHGEAQADAYFLRMIERFQQIADDPLLYPAVNDIRDGYRRSVCGRDSIYYRIDNDEVEIVAIIGRQDLDEWL